MTPGGGVRGIKPSLSPCGHEADDDILLMSPTTTPSLFALLSKPQHGVTIVDLVE